MWANHVISHGHEWLRDHSSISIKTGAACTCSLDADIKWKKFEMHHKDPRRFGWLHTHENMQVVREITWSRLGPDALEISPDTLFQNMQNRRCAVKAAL